LANLRGRPAGARPESTRKTPLTGVPVCDRPRDPPGTASVYEPVGACVLAQVRQKPDQGLLSW